VHGGKLHDGRRFAMKIQYPGVARSIESDVDNLMRLINIANLLPKGLYVEQAAEVRNWGDVYCANGSPYSVCCPLALEQTPQAADHQLNQCLYCML